jgi:hypothetical protein
VCWNKGRLCWKIAKLFYFCHLKKLVRPENFGSYYVRLYGQKGVKFPTALNWNVFTAMQRTRSCFRAGGLQAHRCGNSNSSALNWKINKLHMPCDKNQINVTLHWIFFSLHQNLQIGSEARTTSCSIGKRGDFPWGKAAGKRRWLLTSI